MITFVFTRLKYIILFFLLLPSFAYGTTYYVLEGGNDTDPTGANCGANSMSPSTHNSTVFSGGDLIYLCDTITSAIATANTSGGSSGNHLVYDGSYSGHAGIIDGQDTSGFSGMFRITGESYITIQNITIQDADAAGVMIKVTDRSHHLTFDNITGSQTETADSSNQGMIHLEYAYEVDVLNSDFTGSMVAIFMLANDSSNHWDVYNIIGTSKHHWDI